MNPFPYAIAILVPLFGMVFVGAIVITPMVLRSQERQRLLSTLRQMHEEGQQLTPEMLDAIRPHDPLGRLPSSPVADLRRGLILIAVALGLVILGAVLDTGYDGALHPVWPVIGAAAFPGLIGLAFVAMFMFKLNTQKT
ncbi:MAG TPA: DUF6249 domain-containing protein [Caulobacteraceae bacterium]|nr:DUF6249 domain-containing protein [Caulobacteraceae bacterium]